MRHCRPDPWLVGVTALLLGSIAPVHPFAVLLVGLSGLVAIGRRLSPWAFAACVPLLLGGAARVSTVLAEDTLTERRIRDTIGPHARCAFVGYVATMPVRVSSRDDSEAAFRVDLDLRSLSCDGVVLGVPPGDRVRLHGLRIDSSPVRGDALEGVADLGPVRRMRNGDLGDPRPGVVRRGVVMSGVVVTATRLAKGDGILASIDDARNALRHGLDRTLDVDASSLARALVLGEEDLADDDDAIFRRSGLVHLLAVSGSHVALVVGGLIAALRAMLIRIDILARRIEVSRLAAAIGLPLCLVYEQIAGDSGSARRATAMAVIVLFVRATGRQPAVTRTLALAVLSIWAFDPLCPFDMSFSLSLCATCGLIVASTWKTAEHSVALVLPTSLRDSLLATVAATVAGLPLILAYGAELPLLSIPANLLGAPVGELAALPLANAAALGGAIFGSSFPGRLLGTAAAVSLRLLRYVASCFGRPSFAVLQVPPPTVEQIAAFVAAVPWILRGVRWRVVVPCIVVVVSCLEVAHLAKVRPRGVLSVHVLDVGQGDSVLVDLPNGSAMLIDGGGEVSGYDVGSRIVLPVLAMRRRTELEVLVLSHPHPDHLLGLLPVSAKTRVHAFWHNGLAESETEDSYRALLQELRRRQVPIWGPARLCDQPLAVGGALVELLHPCGSNAESNERFDRHTNDGSLVMRISYGRRSALLVGDAEKDTEQHLLMTARERLDADMLKIGHHGSQSSTGSDFVEAVSPNVATISCGARNRFGHPHPRTLRVLDERALEVHRTDREGALHWNTDGEKVWWSVDATRR